MRAWRRIVGPGSDDPGSTARGGPSAVEIAVLVADGRGALARLRVVASRDLPVVVVVAHDARRDRVLAVRDHDASARARGVERGVDHPHAAQVGLRDAGKLHGETLRRLGAPGTRDPD